MVHKVKAHVTDIEVTNGYSKVDRDGNCFVDAAANDGRRMHPQDADATNLARKSWVLVQTIGRFLARINLVALEAADDMPAPPDDDNTASVERVARPPRHSTVVEDDRLRCVWCLRTALVGHSIQGECVQASAHRIWKAGDLFICARCGAYSQVRATNIRGKCEGRKTRAGAAALNKVFNDQKHPSSNAPLPEAVLWKCCPDVVITFADDNPDGTLEEWLTESMDKEEVDALELTRLEGIVVPAGPAAFAPEESVPAAPTSVNTSDLLRSMHQIAERFIGDDDLQEYGFHRRSSSDQVDNVFTRAVQPSLSNASSSTEPARSLNAIWEPWLGWRTLTPIVPNFFVASGSALRNRFRMPGHPSGPAPTVRDLFNGSRRASSSAAAVPTPAASDEPFDFDYEPF